MDVWATSLENHVSELYYHLRLKQTFSAIAASREMHVCAGWSDVHGCAGWSAQLLFAYSINRFCHAVDLMLGVTNMILRFSEAQKIKIYIRIWGATWQNQQNGMCAQWIFRSAWAFAQSDQSPLSAWRKLGVLSYPLSAQRRLWSDWADAQADLSLRWAHMPFFFGFVIRRLNYDFYLRYKVFATHFHFVRYILGGAK